MAKLTLADSTPSVLRSMDSTLTAQDAQVMPRTGYIFWIIVSDDRSLVTGFVTLPGSCSVTITFIFTKVSKSRRGRYYMQGGWWDIISGRRESSVVRRESRVESRHFPSLRAKRSNLLNQCIANQTFRKHALVVSSSACGVRRESQVYGRTKAV